MTKTTTLKPNETSITIEMKETPQGDRAAVYAWSVYGPNSVLAGQACKRFVEYHDTTEEAQKAHPTAEVVTRSAHNTYSHLPGPEDPVPGGMYPDDIEDGI